MTKSVVENRQVYSRKVTKDRTPICHGDGLKAWEAIQELDLPREEIQEGLQGLQFAGSSKPGRKATKWPGVATKLVQHGENRQNLTKKSIDGNQKGQVWSFKQVSPLMADLFGH